MNQLTKDIIKSDMKKLAKTTLDTILESAKSLITYPIAFPTAHRLTREKEEGNKHYGKSNFANSVGGSIGSLMAAPLSTLLYCELSLVNPKAIPYVAGAQALTNIASGFYEYSRWVNKRVKITEEAQKSPTKIK